MRRRFFSAVILAILGIIGPGGFRACTDMHVAYADVYPLYTNAHPTYADALITSDDTSTPSPENSGLEVTITSVGNPTIHEGEKLRVETRVTNKSDSSLVFAAELRVYSDSLIIPAQ